MNVLKDDEFKKHINTDKNDFADWIRNSIGNDEWADIADTIITKADYQKFLELLYEGKEKTFKVTTPREKPYSSKKAEVPVEEKKEDKTEEKKSSESQSLSNSKKKEDVQSDIKPDEKVSESVATKPTVKTELAKPQISTATTPPAISSTNTQKPLSQPNTNNTPAPVQTQTTVQTKSQGIDWNDVKAKIQTMDFNSKITFLTGLEVNNPNDFNLLFTIASVYHREKDLVNSEIYYKKAIAKNPDNPRTLYYLGTLYTSQKKYNDALETFTKVLELQPGYPKAQDYINSINNLVQKNTQTQNPQ